MGGRTDGQAQTHTDRKSHVSVITFLVIHHFSSQDFRGITHYSLFWRWGDVPCKSTVDKWGKSFPMSSEFSLGISSEKPFSFSSLEWKAQLGKEQIGLKRKIGQREKCHKKLCTCHWNTQIPRAFCVTLLKPQSWMRIMDYWIFCPRLLVSEGEENETACSAAESAWDHKTRHRSALSPPGEEASSLGAHWLSPRCPFVSLRVGTLTGNPIMLIWDNTSRLFPPSIWLHVLVAFLFCKSFWIIKNNSLSLWKNGKVHRNYRKV